MIELRRAFDAQEINKIINDASVRPWVAMEEQKGPLDLQPLLSDLRNVLLMLPDGGLLFHWREAGCYEAHIQFLPSARGLVAIKAAQAALHWMFTRTDAMEIWTKVPQKHESAKVMGAALSFTKEFTAGKWNGQDVDHWSLRYPEWLGSAPNLVARGEWFHDRLEAEKARLGLASAPHDSNSFHDRAVGATVDMIFAGQLDKAGILYNRWAKQAGYKEISLTSRNPVIWDIQECLLVVQGEDFSIMPKQAKGVS